MKRNLFGFIAILVLASVSITFAADPVIIANKDVATASVDQKLVQNIYLGKTTKWDDGAKIVPVLLQSGATHEAFLATYIKQSASQFNGFWTKAVFTGTGTPPKSFSSEQELVDYVANTSGAVGYTSTPSDAVKTLSITP